MLGHDLTRTILTDWHAAPIGERLRRTLGFLEKLTLSPRPVDSQDIVRLRATGVTDQAIIDAVYICVAFNIINRVADGLGVRVPSADVFVRNAHLLLRSGYKLLSGVWFETAAGSVRASSASAELRATVDPYARKFQQLKETVLSGPGSLDPAIRQAAGRGEEIPGVLGSYVKRVRERADTVTDEDIGALCDAGYSEDQIFEATVSAALGAGLVRLEAGLTALKRAGA